MKPLEIRGEMVRHEITTTGIAKMFDISRCFVSRVIHGKSTSKRVQEAIAESINKPYKIVWPGKTVYNCKSCGKATQSLITNPTHCVKCGKPLNG